MKLHPQDLDKITAVTLRHYNQSAEDFRDGTRDHDVSQNIDALLRNIEGEPPFTIAILHEVDRLATGVVLVAVLGPLLRVPWRYA